MNVLSRWSTLDIVGNERDCLLKLVEELESQTQRNTDKKYLDNVRQCCIELLAYSNVDPVIKCVLKRIASIDVK